VRKNTPTILFKKNVLEASVISSNILKANIRNKRTWIDRRKHQTTSNTYKNIVFSDGRGDDSLLVSSLGSAPEAASCKLLSIDSLFCRRHFLFKSITTNSITCTSSCGSQCRRREQGSNGEAAHSCDNTERPQDESIRIIFCNKRKESNIVKHNYNHTYLKLRLILSNDVETNPGPTLGKSSIDKEIIDSNNLFVATYNVRGCKNYHKLKRLTNIFNKLKFKENCVIALQETHLDKNDEQNLKQQWKFNSVQSLANGISGGVAILYNKNYFDEIIETRSDTKGRYCILIAMKNDITYQFINVYTPNDNSDKLEFLKEMEEILWDLKNNEPGSILFITGDFNLVLNPNVDSINRQQSVSEKKAADYLKEIMNKFGLLDNHRTLSEYGGFTWGRNNPNIIRSRLDLILMSKEYRHNLMNTSVHDLNESDHKLVLTEINIDEIKFGPGIIRANSELLKDPEIKERVKIHIKGIIEGEAYHLNPHEKLDYVKLKLREVLLKEGKIKAKVSNTNLYYINQEINLLKDELDKELVTHSMKKCVNHLDSCFKKIDYLKEAIMLAELDLEPYKEEESRKLIFRSKAKWAEKGEKSNKYFLNLLKERQRRMQIRKIIANGKLLYEQNEISKAITNFYKSLYSKQNVERIDEEQKMFKDLPKLNEDDQKSMNKDLSLEELSGALKTCNESSPGPDGITYRTHEHLWDIMGPLILSSWQLSSKIGYTSKSQRHSMITLLEKNGKDKTKIENLRPISLTNCDAKICTKALAIRMNKILDKLINKTQTGYVPGRQVNDNSRMIEEIIEQYKLTNKIGYLITLDAQKAFDSVDHNYLINILRTYKFPEKFVSWIKTLYTGLTATVLINGYKSLILCSQLNKVTLFHAHFLS
jgi:hypothetical protein